MALPSSFSSCWPYTPDAPKLVPTVEQYVANGVDCHSNLNKGRNRSKTVTRRLACIRGSGGRRINGQEGQMDFLCASTFVPLLALADGNSFALVSTGGAARLVTDHIVFIPLQ